MASFFIDTSTGQVATQRQLVEAGVVALRRAARRARGTASRAPATRRRMWYAVLRRQEKGVYIGTLVLRHTDHYASLLEQGWEEVPVEEIGLPVAAV